MAVHGESMLPSLSPGTWIWIRPFWSSQSKAKEESRIRLGDLIVFLTDRSEEPVCHRVIRYNRKWVWEASEHYGTYSRIPYSSVIGKVHAIEKKEGNRDIPGIYSRFRGFFRCYIALFIRRLRLWVRRSV